MDELKSWENEGKVFFDSMGNATNFNLFPSVENVLEMGHEEFEALLRKYKVGSEGYGSVQDEEKAD